MSDELKETVQWIMLAIIWLKVFWSIERSQPNDR